ncbi:MAG: hypothetical protein OXI79_05515 [Gammaproteobacteria bacterium]|nr:hypothetical protein [Gammaproteobacteria bacterium]
MATGNDLPTTVRYEADEQPPLPLSVGLGIQLMVLIVAGIVLTPAIVIRAAGGSETYLAWAVFAAVAISGTTTVMQAVRFGRIGAGYVLAMGTSGAFIAICVTALVEGGPALLATLVVVSALFQFAFSARLSLFRRVLTPTVAGTVIMLIAVTVMPIIFGMLTEVPEDSPPLGAPISAVATLITVCAIALKATGALRLWAPVIGVVVGSAVAAYFGLYDTNRVAEASWIGFPTIGWPGFDLEFSAAFWSLLPAFIFVTLVGAIETIGDSVAIQRVSWKRPKAVDFRAVQGAVAADGMGNLLSGLAGTVPNTTYSSSVSVTELTGVGARVVGLVLGLVMIAFAFFPKALAVVLAIPGPVAAAYVTVLLAMLFVVGMKIIVQDGVDYRKGLIVGVSFWLGVGFQNGVIFPEFLADFAGGLLQNGMTAGGLAAILLTLFVELTAPRRRRIELAFELSALPGIREFLAGCASRYGWNEAMTQRLDAASEETLLTLLQGDGERGPEPRRLQLTVHKQDGGATLEFIAAPGEANLEDRIALLNDRLDETSREREVSLRLLRHLASSVRHQQYHDTDIVTVAVDLP